MTSPPDEPEIYGAEDQDPVIQRIGDVFSTEGRTVVYSNTFQTRLNDFGLADASNPGHYRILTLHNLNPDRSNMSTAMAPYQPRDWKIRQRSPRMRRVPIEIFEYG